MALWTLALAPVAAHALSSSAYVANVVANGGVSQFDIGTGGALTPKAPATVNGGDQPFAVAVSPDGKSVYVTNEGSTGPDAVSQYDVGPGGALTAKSTPAVAAGNQPQGIAVSPDGKSVYVANFFTSGPGAISQYDVGAGGALTPKSPPTVAASASALGVAVSPDGKSVYVTASGGVWQYDVGPGGALTPKSTPTVGADNGPAGIAVSPDGKSVYVVNQITNDVSQYDVGVGGALTRKSTPTVPAGKDPDAVAVSPDGKSVYVANGGAKGPDGVSQYDVGAGGALTPKATPTVAAGNGPSGVAVSPDGKSVYVVNDNVNGAGGVSQYDVGADGALSPKSTPTATAGNGPNGVAVLPDQGPVAAFSASAAPARSGTSFDGSASRDQDGTIVRYAWSFGDGTNATTSSPTLTHDYARAGTYTATLTVTDDAGCSTAFVFTGQTAYCNGGPQALTTLKLSIRPPRPKITNAKISRKHHRAKFSFKARGSSSFQCALVKLGKPKHKHHKRPKPHFTACKRSKSYKHLKAGKYRFFVRALASTGPGQPASRRFTIR